MGAISDEAIRERAYDIWEREGRPHGRDFEHWVRAQVELIAEVSTNNTGRQAAVARPGIANAKAAAPNSNARGAGPKASRSAPTRGRARSRRNA